MHPSREILIADRAHDQVHMIRHQACGENWHRQARLRTGNQRKELLVVGTFVKYLRPLIGAVQDVIAVAAKNGARGAGHGRDASAPDSGRRPGNIATTGENSWRNESR
jgi:hypothetical protein